MDQLFTTESKTRVDSEPEPEPQPNLSRTAPLSPPPQRPRGAPSPRAMRNRPKTAQPIPSPEQVQPLEDQFVQGKIPKEADPVSLAVVTRTLREKRDNLIGDGQIQQSLRFNSAFNAAKSQQLTSLKRLYQEERTAEVKSREEEGKHDFDSFISQMKQEEAEMNQRIKEQEEALAQKHARERDELDEFWTSEVKSRQFNRSSQKIRILRIQQKLLINAMRFDEAAQVNRMADQLVQQESKQSHYNMISDYEKAATLLEQKQQDESDTLSRSSAVTRGEFHFKYERATVPFSNRMKKLLVEEEFARDPEKFWNRFHLRDGDPIHNICGDQGCVRTGMKTRGLDVNDFNTLPLPPLPVKSKKKSGKQQQTVDTAVETVTA